jgi:hypothetical protein
LPPGATPSLTLVSADAFGPIIDASIPPAESAAGTPSLKKHCPLPNSSIDCQPLISSSRSSVRGSVAAASIEASER